MLETFAVLAGRVLDRPPRLGPVRLVAVDGKSGAGKTTFAHRLAAAIAPAASVTVMHTDAVLDGWTPPDSVWPRLREWVLDPLARGVPGAYRRYDWMRARFADGWIPVPVPTVLILEGTTSAFAGVRSEVSLSVLLTADRAVRWRRALARDGERIAGPLRVWQAAEDRHFVTDRTVDQVDVVVDGAASVRHDPEVEFVRLPSKRATPIGEVDDGQ